MTIELTPELEAAVAAEAARQGMTPEDLTLSALRAQCPTLFLPPPVNEWHAHLRAAAVHTGIRDTSFIASRENINEDYPYEMPC